MSDSLKKSGIDGRIKPFDNSGIMRGTDGILHYEKLDASLLAMFRRIVADAPDAEALVEVGGARLNYREFWDRSSRVSGGLRKQGIEVGDRVAIRLGNGVTWCLAFLGTLMAGAVVVPINTRLTPSEVEYILADSGARFTFDPEDQLPDDQPYVVESLKLGDLAGIFYTSGTTGAPKGAMLTHENFLSNAETCTRLLGFVYGDVRNLVSVPLFHVTGCTCQFLPTCANAGTTVIMPTFEVQHFLRTIGEEQINILASVPAIYWLAVHQENFQDFDLSSVRTVTYGGAPTPSEQVTKLMKAFSSARLTNGFGLTETSGVTTLLPHEFALARPESVGFAAPPVELDLFERDPLSGVGELLVRGPNVVSGYWNKPEASAEVFVDGWLHTGDIAKVDEDGYCQIVDRKKDMVNRGGENVYCVEVENVLASHPSVHEVAVMGVADPMMGEKVGAVIVVRAGMTFDSKDLISFASERLADFKVPQFVAVRTEPLPRNPGGKTMKQILRKETEWGQQI